MKKIKNIGQLKAEKQQLEQRRQLLELKIRDNWSNVKESLKPANIAKETFNKVLSSRPLAMIASSGLLKGALAFGVSLLAEKALKKGAGKLGKLLKNKSMLSK